MVEKSASHAETATMYVGKCTMRSVTYETRCLPCQSRGEDKIYIGETARSSYERGSEHLDAYKFNKEDSHMANHALEDHKEEKKPEFAMKLLRNHKSPLYRQIHEAILIAKYEPITLNNKNEYNRCLLPRLSVMIGNLECRGDQESSKNSQDTMDDEESIEKETKRKEKPEEHHQPRKKRKIQQRSRSESRRMENLPMKRKRLSEVNNEVEKTTESPLKRKKISEKNERTVEIENEHAVEHILPKQHSVQSPAARGHYNASSASLSVKNQPTQSKPNLKPTAKNLINFFENLKSKPKQNIQTPCANVQPKPKPRKNHPKKNTPAKLKPTNVVNSTQKYFVKPKLNPSLSPTIKSGPELKLKNCPVEQLKMKPQTSTTSPTITAKFPAQKQVLLSGSAAKGIKKITFYFETKKRREPEEALDPPKKSSS